MARIKGQEKEYTPFEALVEVLGRIGKSLTKRRDVDELFAQWEGMSKEERKSLLENMAYESLAGEGGMVKIRGALGKSANVLKHTLSPETLEQVGKEVGVGKEGTADVSRKLVEELGSLQGAGTGLRAKVKRMGVNLTPLSPETIYGFERSGAGKKIYRIMDLADQGMNRFMVNQVNEFQGALGKIEAGSRSSRRVGRALDGKLPMDQLNGGEKKLYTYLKDQFDFLINRYARVTLGDDKAYRKIASAVSSSNPPKVAVKDLSKKLKGQYDRQVGNIIKWVGGRDVKSLNKKDAAQLKKMQGVLKNILHKGWVDELPSAEKEVYSLMKRKVKNYLPHIFDRDELLSGLVAEQDTLKKALGKATEKKELTRIKKRLVSVENSINKLKGGEMVTYEHLPENLRFKFFDPRKGAQGYSFDAVKAYDSYLRGISRKIYQEPAMRQVKELYGQLSPAYRQYVTKHVKDWVGLSHGAGMELANAVTSLQWMAKLGINPRSAITNFAQRINTIADVGEKNAIKGYLKGWTKEGDELFKSTGLAQEVPSVLLEGSVPKGLERAKNIMGWLFSKVEIGNRKGAFLAGLEQAKQMGLSGKAAIQHGIDVVHKTQFRYGSIGMPAPLRTAPGKVAMQFWSYPIKQVEFLAKLLRRNPMKLAKWALYAEGGRELVEKAGYDMGNAMGLGFEWGELVEAAKQVPEKDWDNMWKHLRLANQGGGLVPGYSPTIGAMINIGRGVDKGRGLEAFKEELTPVQVKKFQKLQKGYEGSYVSPKTGERMLPWYDKEGRLDTELTQKEALTETLGPRLEKLSELSLEKSKEYELEKLKGNLRRDMNRAIREGDQDTANSIAERLLDMGDVGERMLEREIPWDVRHELRRDLVTEELLK